MPMLMLKDLPRYECLLEGARQNPDLDPSACEAFLTLLRTGDEVFGVVERRLSEHNLSQGRFSVLMLLWKVCARAPESACEIPARPPTPAELAEAAGVTRATMTGLVDTLERDGLVRREPDPNDRRMMWVQLTPKGETLIKEMLPLHFRMMACLMQPLSETERKTMVRLLNKVLEQASAQRTPAQPN